jgi:predicted nucleic acid-binding protein
MSAKVFLDTNILVYAVTSTDPRQVTAQSLCRQGGTISVQVLNEFANVAAKKLGFSWREVCDALHALRSAFGEPVPITVSLHAEAVGIAERHRLSFYDALILAAAREAGCREVLTEDLRDGAVLDGVSIRNPFS